MALLDGYASHVLRSEGIGDAVADALLACGRSARRESFASLAASFGFDGFSYLLLAGPAAQPRLLEHWTSSGPAWTARYAARGYHLVDPRVTLTRNRSVPVTWGQGAASEERHMRDFLEDAGRHDVRSGVAWSACDARVGRAVVAWDAKDTAPIRHSLATIALLAGAVHETLVARCSAPATQSNAPLTERERECMALVARGMTSADVGVKLGITARTANFHIGNVMVKLGAVSRGEAIARAITANLVSIDR
jgi:DNA-binding CsgD family transcriptional regulator